MFMDKNVMSMVAGNFNFRCELRLSSVHVGVENFAIPVNEKFR